MVVIKICIEFETKHYWNPFIGSYNEEKHYWDLLLHHLMASKLKLFAIVQLPNWSIVDFRLIKNMELIKYTIYVFFMLL
jgi:hypothetical protein